jgi:hypothetical protein
MSVQLENIKRKCNPSPESELHRCSAPSPDAP